MLWKVRASLLQTRIPVLGTLGRGYLNGTVVAQLGVGGALSSMPRSFIRWQMDGIEHKGLVFALVIAHPPHNRR